MRRLKLVIFVIMAVGVWFFALQTIKIEAGQITPVEVLQTGYDSIGVRFAYQVKEVIRKSSSYRLSSVDLPRLRILMATKDLANELAGEEFKQKNRNIKSVMSLVYTLLTNDGEFYIQGALVSVGGKTIKEQAEEIVARIEKFEWAPSSKN